MIDLIIAYLALIVILLLLIIIFLTFYIIYERRKITISPLNKDKKIIVPLLSLKTNDKSSGDHLNVTTHKRMTKRLRHRPRTLFIRTQNSQGFILSTHNKLTQENKISAMDQTTIHFDN